MKTPASLMHHDPVAESFFAEGCFITEWWNSTADAAVSVARARVEPGATTRWHRLRNITERYLILDGQGRVEVGELPAEDVGPGAVVLVPPGVRPPHPHRGGRPDPSGGLHPTIYVGGLRRRGADWTSERRFSRNRAPVSGR